MLSPTVEKIGIEVDTLLELAAGVEPGSFTPDTPVAKGERVISETIDEDLKRLYGLMISKDRDEKMFMVSAEYERKGDQKDKAIGDVLTAHQEAELVKQIFWYCLNKRYATAAHCHLAVREGWKVVQYPCSRASGEEQNLPPFLRALLFGGGSLFGSE